jgi:hypothetical protein
MLGEIIRAGQRNEGYIKLERDFATHPLPGVDVPFQSRYLCAGVKPFRACKTTPALYELRLLMNLSQIYRKRSRLRTSILTCLLGNTFQISFPSRSTSLTNARNTYTTRRHLCSSTSDHWADATQRHTSFSWSSWHINSLLRFVGLLVIMVLIPPRSTTFASIFTSSQQFEG